MLPGSSLIRSLSRIAAASLSAGATLSPQLDALNKKYGIQALDRSGAVILVTEQFLSEQALTALREYLMKISKNQFFYVAIPQAAISKNGYSEFRRSEQRVFDPVREGLKDRFRVMPMTRGKGLPAIASMIYAAMQKAGVKTFADPQTFVEQGLVQWVPDGFDLDQTVMGAKTLESEMESLSPTAYSAMVPFGTAVIAAPLSIGVSAAKIRETVAEGMTQNGSNFHLNAGLLVSLAQQFVRDLIVATSA